MNNKNCAYLILNLLIISISFSAHAKSTKVNRAPSNVLEPIVCGRLSVNNSGRSVDGGRTWATVSRHYSVRSHVDGAEYYLASNTDEIATEHYKNGDDICVRVASEEELAEGNLLGALSSIVSTDVTKTLESMVQSKRLQAELKRVRTMHQVRVIDT